MAQTPAKIVSLKAREVFDDMGYPTVEVDLVTDYGLFRGSVPSGAVTGMYEGMRTDGEKLPLLGKDAARATKDVNDVIAPKLVGMEVTQQRAIDCVMTEDLAGFKNATLAVSVAICRAGAASMQLPLYEYIAKIAGKPTDKFVMPVPSFNVMDGGVIVPDSRLLCFEFTVLPTGAKSFREALQMGAEVHESLRAVVEEKYGRDACKVGSEGGLRPLVQESSEALELLATAIRASGHEGRVKIGADASPCDWYADGVYDVDFKNPNGSAPEMKKTGEALGDYYKAWCDEYPLVSIEDPFVEDDYDAWTAFTEKVGKEIQLVGNDLLFTNTKRIQKALDCRASNALLLKITPNRIGSITEAIDAANLAQHNGWGVVTCYRSGEIPGETSGDSFMADLAVGLRTGQLKTGAPCRDARLRKYNQLLRIEQELGPRAVYPGADFRCPPW